MTTEIISSNFHHNVLPVVPEYLHILLARARQQGHLNLAPKPSLENGIGWQELPVAQAVVMAIDGEAGNR
jgi:hypothetical protein